MAEFIRLMRESESPPLDRDLTPKIIARLPDGLWKSKPIKGTIWRLPATAAALFITLILIFLFASRKTERERFNNPLPISDTIKSSIDWLIKAQEPSGKWDAEKWGGRKEYTIGLTGLALLALLTEDRPNALQKSAMEKAVDYIKRQQSSEGYFGKKHNGLMYNHAIATIALLMFHKRYGKRELIRPLDSAIRYIRSSQREDGGWGYTYGSANTPVSVWQLYALTLARRAGCRSVKHNIERGIRWMRKLTDERGFIGYRKKGDYPYGTETLFLMSSFCLLTTEPENERLRTRIRDTLKQILSEHPRKRDYYRLYFLINILLLNGDVLSDYTAELQKELLQTQVKRGENSGSWEPNDRWSSVGGRIYSTVMATLSLSKEPLIRRTKISSERWR